MYSSVSPCPVCFGDFTLVLAWLWCRVVFAVYGPAIPTCVSWSANLFSVASCYSGCYDKQEYPKPYSMNHILSSQFTDPVAYRSYRHNLHKYGTGQWCTLGTQHLALTVPWLWASSRTGIWGHILVAFSRGTLSTVEEHCRKWTRNDSWLVAITASISVANASLQKKRFVSHQLRLRYVAYCGVSPPEGALL